MFSLILKNFVFLTLLAKEKTTLAGSLTFSERLHDPASRRRAPFRRRSKIAPGSKVELQDRVGQVGQSTAVLRPTISLRSKSTPDRARFQRDGVDAAPVALHKAK
jgi:hypothetical protein